MFVCLDQGKEKVIGRSWPGCASVNNFKILCYNEMTTYGIVIIMVQKSLCNRCPVQHNKRCRLPMAFMC